jgi:hypothetical protein
VTTQLNPRISAASDHNSCPDWRLFIAQECTLLDAASQCLTIHQAMLLLTAEAIKEMPDTPRLWVMTGVRDIRRFDDNRCHRHSRDDEANPLDTLDKWHCLALLGKTISAGSGNTLPRTLTDVRMGVLH